MIDESKLAELYRLKNLIRYNTRTRMKNETVAEHSYYVALFSLMICDEIGADDTVKLECLIKAILHDLPEIEMNDITHDAKIRMNLSEIVKKYEEAYYQREFPSFAKLMNLDDESLSSTIVSVADVESVRQYIQNERILGNHSPDILEIGTETYERLAKLEKKLKLRRNLL